MVTITKKIEAKELPNNNLLNIFILIFSLRWRSVRRKYKTRPPIPPYRRNLLLMAEGINNHGINSNVNTEKKKRLLKKQPMHQSWFLNLKVWPSKSEQLGWWEKRKGLRTFRKSRGRLIIRRVSNIRGPLFLSSMIRSQSLCSGELSIFVMYVTRLKQRVPLILWKSTK